ACVQTGRHCMRFGMINVNVGKLPAGEITIAKICKSMGYTTGHFGKWHLGTMTRDADRSQVRGARAAEGYSPPWERGYDTTFTTETNIATWDPLDYTDLRIPKHSCRFWSNGEEVKGDWKGSSEKIIMDRAISFAKDAVADGKPFMATVWFYGPHSPVRAGKKLRDLYPDQPLGRQHYLGAITAIDRQVGRLRAELDKLGTADNTLIFFCSDNGPEGTGTPEPDYNPYGGAYYGSAGNFRGRKRYLYNGGVCVPAVAIWPDVIEPGRTVDTAACTLDYLPTVAALLGYSMPDSRPIDGTSILALLRGGPFKRTKPIPFASKLRKDSPDATWIDGDYKFCTNLTHAGADALYHLHDDPGEKSNIL
ncbi:MAG: sulfatase-like hydrolase/transferase, partial [Planctomycetes bacterium]|nr:sulfatase-like hydrolase/transferase [Planctomycetota bacterium]